MRPTEYARWASGNYGEASAPDAIRKPAVQSAASLPVPLRSSPKGGFFLHDNEVVDVFLPIIGPHAGAVYAALIRMSYAKAHLECSVRKLALVIGISAATVARSLQILKEVGLVRLSPTSGNRKSICDLLDVKALAASYGGQYDRKASAYVLPQSAIDHLKAKVTALRLNQQGRTKAAPTAQSKPSVRNASQGGLESLSSISHRDACVSPLLRQRSARETQTGAHLLQEETRIEIIPAPTPPLDCESQKPKSIPDEVVPDAELNRARAKLTGVVNDMKSHLLDPNRPHASHLTNGLIDWQAIGFNSMAVERVSRRGTILKLTLSVNDPVAARRGLDKYHNKWEASLREWYGGEVQEELIHGE